MTEARVADGSMVVAPIASLAARVSAARRPGRVSAVPPGAKAGDLTLRACTVRTSSGDLAAERGDLVVPENRGAAGSRLLTLPVVRLRATGPSPSEPVFFREGGSGMSNLRFEPPAWLLTTHDVVTVGYHGVDGPVVLDCPEVRRALRGVDGDLLSAASRSHLAAAATAAADRLRRAGVDLDGYTVAEVAEDLEAARAALGYPRVDLLSQSYGTRVAQVYAALHPERVHRSVMIGVNPPGRFVWDPATVDRQLAHHARLRGNAGALDLVEAVRRVVRAMPRRWLCVPIDPGKVKVVTFALLFNRGTAARVLDAYLAAARGDPSGLALLSVAAGFALPRFGVWGDFLAKGSSADYDPSRDYAAELDPPGSVLGSPLSLLLFDGLLRGWPVKPLAAELRRARPSAVETLLMSGSVDFSTPAELAATELLPHLAAGTQVVVAEAGHVDDLWRSQPAATERLLTSFLDTGAVDASRFVYRPMEFRVAIGFPALAKAALGSAVVLLLAAAAAAAPLVRRSGAVGPAGRR